MASVTEIIRELARYLCAIEPMVGVLERVYKALAAEGLACRTVFALDSTAVKVHPDAQGARKKTVHKR